MEKGRKQKNPSLPENLRPVFCDITSLIQSPCCTILESISDGVFTIDREKRITSFNRAAEYITGLSRQEAVGQFCFDVFRADICAKNCALEKTLLDEAPQIDISARIITQQGEQKPISLSTNILRNAKGEVIGGVETFRDLSDLKELQRRLDRQYVREDIVGKSPQMQKILSFLPDIAESDSSVLIQGPTGTGKELAARAIHNLSRRNKGPFVAVNCAALPEGLLESELFGHVKGAFTGAVRDKSGYFLAADQGTLFLDEIGTTPFAFQSDLLRVLESREFTPVGGTRTVKSDFRIIAAANHPLKQRVADGEFREDLFYRLNVVTLELPPLSERREDTPLLADRFIEKFNLSKGKNIREIAPDALQSLMEYSFPGNVRELENAIEYAFITCKGSVIRNAHLPPEIARKEGPAAPRLSEEQHMEAEKIRTFLKQHANSREKTAKALGISRSTLWRKMKKLGITPPESET
ncbi:MAG: sigma 54-interacting transcriptional regulator [Desulfobacterales bacterium]|nr:sigma 54-interacting transcriptional regulator [Desulfobacterales bacterium]